MKLTIAQTIREQRLIRALGTIIWNSPIGSDLDAGVTTAEQRRDNIRRAILARGLAHELVDGTKPRMTFAQCFRLTYDEPLEREDVVR